MGKKGSSNKPSKQGQRDRTAANKVKHKKIMTDQYVKKHGSTDGMPDWDAKPDFTSKVTLKLEAERQHIIDLIKGKKNPTKEEIKKLREVGCSYDFKTGKITVNG